MKTFLHASVFLISILFSLPFYTNSQTFEWAKRMPSDMGNAISVDANGYSYISGYFVGDVLFDTVQLTSNGDYDMFLAKYDQGGTCLWAKNAGGTDSDQGVDVSVDPDGNIYVTGTFNGIATFGTVQLTCSSPDYNDIFIAKYIANGNLLWVNQVAGLSDKICKRLSFDANGNIYAAGQFDGIISFGTIELTTYGDLDIFITKFNPDGNCLWAKHAGGTGQDIGYGISSDASGNSYLTGVFEGNASFGTIPLSSFGLSDVFLAKYNSDGNCIWAKKAGGTNSEIGAGVSNDANGNIYITGLFRGTVNFGTNQLTVFGGNDIYIARYDTNGNCIWAKQAGGTNNDYGYGVSTDVLGNCYVVGYFSSISSFGINQLTSYGGTDIFIAKYDINGNCVGAVQAGGTLDDRSNDISVDINGNSYITGYFTGNSAFGNITLTGSGAVIAKIPSDQLPVELSSFTYKILNNYVALEWVTQTEVNNNRFELERKNQNTAWIKITEIPGAGNSYSPRKYSFSDKEFLSNGIYYYR
jgi:hypothetical protein